MAATSHMHNLTTLIKRLEAATSRLEDIASSTELPKDVAGLTKPVASPQPEALSTPPVPASKPIVEPLPESIEEFDAFVDTTVAKYVKLSDELGGLIAQQAAAVLKGFKEQRKFLLISTKAKKPDTMGSDVSAYTSLLRPINEALAAVSDIKEANRQDPMCTHLAAVAAGMMVLAWVTVDNKPFKHVEESLGSAQFFGNRVLKEYKGKDQKHVDWIQSFYQIFRDLTKYVKQYYPNGIPWNPHGEPAQEVAKSISTSSSPEVPTPAAAGGAPPPPPPAPPPGPPPILDVKTESTPAAPSGPAGGLNAVFSELNKGEAVTKGLRKVDRSEMTHKNPSLRAGSVVVDGSARGKSPAPVRKPKPESMRVKKPPVKELEGNKWTIENFDKESQPVEIDASLTQSILISRCNNTTVIVRGKANQVTVENSSRLSLVVDSLVSTVDVVKAQNFALQVMGAIPTVMLDQVDGAQVYFSKESISTKVFTSKSDGVNLNVISGPDEDYKEVPLPSQICSYFDEGKGDLVSEIVAHAG